MSEDTLAADRTFSEAVSHGHYDLYQGGLCGKHDNVRAYWEEAIRGRYLRPHLQALVGRRRREGGRVRIADLGAGSGEALRLMTSLNWDEADVRLNQAKVLRLEDIELYAGSDLNEAMVAQGRENFAGQENVRFEQGDFSEGFPLAHHEPFDLYCCSFASLSHIDRPQFTRLLDEILEHTGGRAIFVGDWLGRHSIEWPQYWSVDGDDMMPYSMSWLPGAVGGDEQPEVFPMRYWTGDELRALLQERAQKAGLRVRGLEMFDCSIFVGRHVDTGEYNEWVRPLRSAVNSLHEPNSRTDLDLLRADVLPLEGHNELNGYFAGLQFQWNSLIDYCCARLEKRVHPVDLKNWRQYPPILQMAMMNIDRGIDAAYWMQMGDPRANIIEPQIAYALRDLEIEYQTGEGRAHSVVGVLEVTR
jgi:SAM-dependent methyltransferase